jgi:hypothetical protein
VLFDATAHSTMMFGRDDYRNILKAVRENLENRKPELEEECRRVSVRKAITVSD